MELLPAMSIILPWMVAGGGISTPLLNIEITLDGLARKETTDFKNL